MKRKLTPCSKSKRAGHRGQHAHKKQEIRIIIAEAREENKTVGGRGESAIFTLTGRTYSLHTNTKRKCVSILRILEAYECYEVRE